MWGLVRRGTRSAVRRVPMETALLSRIPVRYQPAVQTKASWECNSGTQTIQVAWNGGITPYISGDTESDLFQYYIGYSDSSGVLIPHVAISIADINDNDNFHQLCFSTSDEIVKISMMAYTVEDPNHDPNLYSEIDVSSCIP